MQEIIDGLKNMTFTHPEMEKRRIQLLDAFEHRCSIPSDEADLWILNKIIVGTLDKETDTKITSWVKRTEILYRAKAWFKSLLK